MSFTESDLPPIKSSSGSLSPAGIGTGRRGSGTAPARGVRAVVDGVALDGSEALVALLLVVTADLDRGDDVVAGRRHRRLLMTMTIRARGRVTSGVRQMRDDEIAQIG